jgi:hypothetical protein
MTLRLLDEVKRNTAKDRVDPSFFSIGLIVIVLVGLVVRVSFAVAMMSRPLLGDAPFFHDTAANVVNGNGYALALVSQPGRTVYQATASHGPVFPMVLAVFDLFGLKSADDQRIALSILASVGVLLMGFLGKRVAGATVGLIAAGIAAVSPLWFQSSGILMSESVYFIAIPTVLLVALLCIERGTVGWFLLLGATIAISVLIRSEAIDLVVLLGLPVLGLAVLSWRQRAFCGAAMLCGLLVVLGPWVIRNDIQMGGLTLSTNDGPTLAGSYCPDTLDGGNSEYGSYELDCAFGAAAIIERHERPPNHASAWSELQIDNALTTYSEKYARQHLGQMPGAIVARERSVWGFGNQQYQLELAQNEGRNRTWEMLGRDLYWVLLPFALVGSIVLAIHNRKAFAVLAVPVLVVAVNAAIFYGSTRMRVAAEPSLAVFAAMGLVAIGNRIKSALGLTTQPSDPSDLVTA